MRFRSIVLTTVFFSVATCLLIHSLSVSQPQPIEILDDTFPKRPITITVVDEYKADRSLGANDKFLASTHVRRVDTSGRPRFTAIEEKVIGGNESRRVYLDFEKNGGFKDIPDKFLKRAKELIFRYQRAITKKASVRAILCDQGDSSGTVPSQLKPHVVHDDYNTTTYNWFLIEYKTYGFARPRSSPRLADKRKYRRTLTQDDTLKDDCSLRLGCHILQRKLETASP